MVSPLDRKLARDLRRMKTQVSAIALVIAVGVLLLVMMGGLLNSLEQTRLSYYQQYRLADIFAPVKRAPQSLLSRIGTIPGVGSVSGRVVGNALINLPNQAAPVQARAVSLPDFTEPLLNNVYLAQGRKLNPRHRDEVSLLEGFAKAHDLGPGSSITATMYGARREFNIVGLAQSPEFLLSTAPGEFVPDDARFAVIWMSEASLAAAFDMEGAFNEFLVSLQHGANERAVIDAIDRILEPYGGVGAYGLDDQYSNIFITEDISQLAVSSATVPPIFLAVAAFLLYIVVSRLIDADRIQIGLLKAFGYSTLKICAHYFKLILLIAIGGALLGCALGVWAGQLMAAYYQIYYKFPYLLFHIDLAAILIAVMVSVASASAGGLLVLRKVFELTPAVAMRPPAPADYSRSTPLSASLIRRLDQPTRMVLRRLMRRPGRSVAAILGIAVGMGLSVAMLGVMDGFNRMVDLNFSVVDRSNANVSLIEPMADKVIYELARMHGVLEVEPFREVSVMFRNGTLSHRGSLSGLISEPQLRRAMSDAGDTIYIRKDGVVLAEVLANKLKVGPGDTLTIDVKEGRQPTLRVPIASIAHPLLGAPAYMELGAINRLLKEPGRVNGAYLRIDEQHGDSLYKQIKNMPSVAGVSLKHEVRRAFRELMDSGAGATRYVMAAIAAVITFGIVYNSARIAFTESSHDLASLRVMGFSNGETSFVLLGELGIIIFLALPLGSLIGLMMVDAIAQGFSTELYSIPSTLDGRSVGYAVVSVSLAALLSGYLVKRDIDRLELVSALKSRE